MKKRKGYLFLICLLCFYACTKKDHKTFEVVSMSLSNSNNTLAQPFDAGTDSVPKKAYAIKMTLNEELRHKSDTGDPEEGSFDNEDQLTSFNIRTLSNFDANHLAGSSMNDYFLTALSSSATISKFISAGKIGQGHLENNNYVDSWSTDQYLFLMSQPISNGNYSFVVDFGLSNGSSMTDTVSVKLY